MLENLPALPVILPLLAASVAALMTPLRAFFLTLLTLWACFAIAAMLAGGSDVISYAFGGHEPPVGIAYRIDGLSRYMLLILSFMAAAMIPYAKKSLAHELPQEKLPQAYALVLLTYAGLAGITLTGDLFNAYVFLEIASLALYALIALRPDRRALTASLNYLILGTIGATFFLTGIFFLYAMTGTLNIADMAARLTVDRATQAGLAFLVLGLLLKCAAFPLHLWLVGAYTQAPSFVAALAAAVGVKVMLYLLIRVSYSFSAVPLISAVLTATGVAGIVAGTLSALYQQDVRRLLAFSSIAQIGTILLGLGIATEAGLTASLAHLANHALAKGALFLCAGCVIYRTGGCNLKDFAGAGRRMPWTMAAFVICGASLAGIPGTAGFVSKWLIVSALLAKGSWALAVLVVVSSLLAAAYVWRVAEAAYFRPMTGRNIRNEAPLLMLGPVWLLVLANLWFGIHTAWTANFAARIAATLMGGN